MLVLWTRGAQNPQTITQNERDAFRTQCLTAVGKGRWRGGGASETRGGARGPVIGVENELAAVGVGGVGVSVGVVVSVVVGIVEGRAGAGLNTAPAPVHTKSKHIYQHNADRWECRS